MRNLGRRFQLETCESGEAAVDLLARGETYAVVVADMQMPGMDGVQLLSRFRQQTPDTVRIMLTGNADQLTAVEAINRGHIFRFLNKPCSMDALAQAITDGLRQHQLIRAEKDLLERTLNGSVKMLMDILSMQDPVAFGLCQRVLARMRSFQKTYVSDAPWQSELAAMLFRIGLITIPPPVLQKVRAGATLNTQEKNLLDRVPEMGATLLAHIPRLEPVAEIIRYQNCRFEDPNHPNGPVAGPDIPLGARTLKVITDLVELEKEGKTPVAAVRAMKERQGWYDPNLLEAAAAWATAHEPPPQPKEPPPRRLKACQLESGDILLSDVTTIQQILILSRGSEINDTSLQIIRNFALLNALKEPIVVRGKE